MSAERRRMLLHPFGWYEVDGFCRDLQGTLGPDVFVALISVAPGKSVKPFGVAFPLEFVERALGDISRQRWSGSPPTGPTLSTWLDAAKDKSVTPLKFILVDSDHRRLRAISDGLARHRGVTVSDSLAVLPGPREGACVALVADGPGSIEAAAERMKAAGWNAKIIAYAEDPSPHRIVKAMAAGAADFLHWPCDHASIIAAATAATASPVD